MKYQSKYSPEENLVSAAQYITELICEKKAQSESRGLPLKFWQIDVWAKLYRNQIAAAHALLKKYDERAILAALRDARTNKIYSLRNKRFLNIVDEKSRERVRVDIELVEHEDEIESSPAKPFGKESLMNKLRGNNE